jgi:hypothetical protein
MPIQPEGASSTVSLAARVGGWAGGARRRGMGRAALLSSSLLKAGRDRGIRASRSHWQRGPGPKAQAALPQCRPRWYDDGPGTVAVAGSVIRSASGPGLGRRLPLSGPGFATSNAE